MLGKPLKKQDMNNNKQTVSVLFMLFSILFCVCLIAANVLETKQISVGPISLTGGFIVFPVSYVCLLYTSDAADDLLTV